MRLPDFIFQAVSQHNTSVGNNDAFPKREDVSFDYIILKHRYTQVSEAVRDVLGYIPTINEAETMMSKLIKKVVEIEKPLRPQLEKLCEAIVSNALGVPQETILLDCELVDKIEPDNELRVLPEDDDMEHTYSFEDIKDFDLTNKDILKRRLINSLVQGASYLLSMDFYDNDQINEWSNELMPLYGKIIALNDYLLFEKKEKISDKNPMLGAYVETHLGKDDEKTVISAQGLIYPLLLQETFRGFFELFASHGLPNDIRKANYILHHADFLVAEAWDLRIGVPLWEKIEQSCGDMPLSNTYPYIFSSLVQSDSFNELMQNVFAGTNKAKKYLNALIDSIKHDEEYNLFKQDIQHFNLDKCVITDDESEANNSLIKENKYDQAFNDIISQLDVFKKEGQQKYNCEWWYEFKWMKANHPEIQIDQQDIEKYQSLLAKEKEINRLWNNADKEEENAEAESVNKWSSEQTNLMALAIKEFGITGRLSQAGYVLPDGKLLNFGSDGDRGTDHRAIEGIYKRNKIQIWNDEYRYNYVVDFLNHGAIRIDANSGLIDMTMEPTTAEYRVLKDIVRKTDGEAYVDFTDNKGNTIHSVEYDHVTPQRLVADIKKYYQEGIRPHGDVCEEKKRNHTLKEEGNFQEWFNGSKVVNADGTPKLMYRGDDNQIDTFDRSYSSSSNLYGTGFYFTDSKSHALQYGNAQPYYLRIVHPLSTDGHEITKQQLYKFLVAVDKNEDYGLYNYGQGSTPRTVLNSIWGKSDFFMILDINACCIGDLVEATLLFNQINGTDFDGFILDTEIVVFDNSQIRKANIPLHEAKNTNNLNTVVCDNAGNPIKCYHSTTAKFNSFDPNKINSGGAGCYHGFGFNFTTQPNTTYGSNVIEAYLTAKKPLWDKKKTINLNKLIKILIAIDKGEVDSIVCNFTGNNPKIGGQGYWYEIEKTAKSLLDYAEGDLDIYANICTAANCGVQKVIDVFSKLGYDSAIETYDDGRLRVVVVFSPEQIHIVSEPLVKESKEIIKEGISDITYHYCSLPALYDILESGKIALTMSTNRSDAYHKTKLFYLSTQRSKNPNLGYAGNSTHQGEYPVVRIELDGELLKIDGYQGQPVDYWGGSMGKQSDIGLKSARLAANYGGEDKIPNFTDTDKEGILKSQGKSTNFEFEDRIFNNKPSMSLKYIKRIDCLEKEPATDGIDKAILELAAQKHIFVGFYASEKDFIMQTDNLSNDVIKSSEMTYKRDLGGRNEDIRQKGNADIVARLSAALMYYKYINNLENGQLKEGFYNQLQVVLQKFGLEQYLSYCEEKLPKMVMFLEQYIGESLDIALRRANTDTLSRNKLSENVMLFAQYVLNHYGANSISALRTYFKEHPWKQNYKETTIQEFVPCVIVDNNQIYRADNTSFWDRFFDKDTFYQEIERQLDEDDWNEQNGYGNENRSIFHKSQNSNSFKKYLQHLAHNDNLSLYDGTVILNKIVNNNQGTISTLFGITIQPIKLNKNSFIQNENKIGWNDAESIRNSLFGSEDGYYEYRWPKNESKQNANKKQLNEYLDKDYMKPLFDYLKNGERYSSGGYYNATDRLVIPFFKWATTQLNNDDWKRFTIALRNCKQLKGKVQGSEFMGHHTIECYSQMTSGLKQVNTNDFLKQNAKHIFNITYNQDPVLSLFWDKFVTQFINTQEGDRLLGNIKSLDADTVLMNPELKKPQWLVHLTPNKNDALDIVKNGFKYGLNKSQMPKLGYTNNGIEKEAKNGKYLYAYNAVEIANNTFPTNFMVKDKSQHKYEKPFDQKTWEYASQFAIMFTAPGIQAYHGTDKQNQVIFASDTAHNYVLLTRGKDFIWQVNTTDRKAVYKNNSLTNVVTWVISNFAQYRKQICWRK